MLTKCSLERLYKLKCGIAAPASKAERADLESEVREHIAGITNPDIRYAMYERYINGHSWDTIANMFCCGTADAVRKRCNRYINRYIKLNLA